MTVNNQLLFHWHKKHMQWPRTVSWITGHSKQFRQHRVKAAKWVKQTCQGDHVTYRYNNEVISNVYVHRKLAGKLSICFSCFQSSSWLCFGENCPIHVTMWNSKLFKLSARFSCLIERNNWLLTAIEAIHWKNDYI